MTEEEYVVEIKMPLKNRTKDQESVNLVLDSFKSFLQTNYGTSDIKTATMIAGAIIATEIAINIATLGVAGLSPSVTIEETTEVKEAMRTLNDSEAINRALRAYGKEWVSPQDPDISIPGGKAYEQWAMELAHKARVGAGP